MVKYLENFGKLAFGHVIGIILSLNIKLALKLMIQLTGTYKGSQILNHESHWT